jgi:hypothetical protein
VTRLRIGRLGVRFLAVAEFLSLHHRFRAGSGVQPASCPPDNGGFFDGVKRPGREPDHSSPSGAEVNNAWSYNSTSPYVFMACYLFKQMDNFTFLHLRE